MTIALCHILFNEAFMLDFQLSSLKGFFPMMVACDFGSTDGTQGILERHGVKWSQEVWPNNYAVARNMVMEKAWASGADAVLFLDGDEMVFPDELSVFLKCAGEELVGFPRVNLRRGGLYEDFSYPDYQVRYVPRLSGLWYRGVVHEVISNHFEKSAMDIYHYSKFKSLEYQYRKEVNYSRLKAGLNSYWSESVPDRWESGQVGVRFDGPIPFTELFSSDWFTPHTETMEPFLDRFKDKQCSILEIGCYEGRSTTWFLRNLPYSKVVAIDTFRGSSEHKELGINFNGVRERFLFNIDRYADRVTLLEGRSQVVLSEMRGEQFNIAFIDGSHEAKDVLTDLCAVFPLMIQGGIIIADDYGWDKNEDPLKNPRLGIDAFLSCFADKIEVLSKDYRVIVRKK